MQEEMQVCKFVNMVLFFLAFEGFFPVNINRINNTDNTHIAYLVGFLIYVDISSVLLLLEVLLPISFIGNHQYHTAQRYWVIKV